MDLLTDILQQAGLRRRLLDLRHLSEASALRFPCDRSIGFHVVIAGRVHLHAPALPEPLMLQTGDIALMARGCDHVVSSLAVLPPGPIGPAAMPPDGTVSGSVLSGAYQLWNRPVHPLFDDLPDWAVVRAEQLGRLNPMSLTIALLGNETREPDLGSQTIVHGLLDATFTYLLREIVAQQGRSTAGWSQAIRHPQIRQAVTLMHEDSARDWTLDELAHRVGLSRTAFAQKFRDAMGDTPLNHLRALRMQKAMQMLSETDDTLDAVASRVGYQDAFSFSRVFKRTVGLAPRDFRRQDAADRAAPWRF